MGMEAMRRDQSRQSYRSRMIRSTRCVIASTISLRRSSPEGQSQTERGQLARAVVSGCDRYFLTGRQRKAATLQMLHRATDLVGGRMDGETIRSFIQKDYEHEIRTRPAGSSTAKCITLGAASETEGDPDIFQQGKRRHGADADLDESGHTISREGHTIEVSARLQMTEPVRFQIEPEKPIGFKIAQRRLRCCRSSMP